jgi:hypothetical protein
MIAAKGKENSEDFKNFVQNFHRPPAQLTYRDESHLYKFVFFLLNFLKYPE